MLEIARSLEGGEEGVSRLRAEKKKFSALITGEDLTAAGALKALQKLGYKVPGDVSVIGFNNLLLAEMTTPGLTSVDNMGEAMAVTAVQTLYNVLQKNPAPPKTALTPRLVVRESTGEFPA